MRQCIYCQGNLKRKKRHAIYCSEVCGTKYRNAKLKKQFTSIEKKNKNCKYCKNSNHEGYCCDEHKKMYQEIIQNIKIAINKPKRKPTVAQLKGYRKIEHALMNRQI